MTKHLSCALAALLWAATASAQIVVQPANPRYTTVTVADGSAAAPAKRYVDDTDLGSYRIGADNEGFSAGGVLRWDYNTTRILSTIPIQLPNTGLKVFDTDSSHYLSLVPGSNLTADRELTLTTGDAARTVTISGNATISQDYSTAGSPNFTNLSLNGTGGIAFSAGGGLTIAGGSDPIQIYPGIDTSSLQLFGGANLANRLIIYGASHATQPNQAVVNETGLDADFRVEGDTDANLLTTDASTDRVGVGTATPGVKFDVSGVARATAFHLTNLVGNTTAPTIGSGFGTSPSVAANNGTAAFTVNVGTGGTASSGVVTMPAATTGWNCTVINRTGVAANRADQHTVQTATTTTSVTVQNQTISTGAALAWTASDVLALACLAY